MEERYSQLYNICETVIKRKSYKTKEEMQTKLDTFYGYDRLTPDEYIKLCELLKSQE